MMENDDDPIKQLVNAVPQVEHVSPNVELENIAQRICEETSALEQQQQWQQQQQQQAPAPPTTTPNTEAAAAGLRGGGAAAPKYLTNKEKFQAEITKWEEFYDQVQQHLQLAQQQQQQQQQSNGAAPSHPQKNLPKSASNFSIGQDHNLYYSRVNKNGSVVYLKVVRNYGDRLRICRDIHLDTGDPSIHYRRDKMMEILGQTYFWKGQRRDVCQCIASCEVCSAGLGAKRKAKPPSQKRDIPRSGPPDPPKKRLKTGRPRKDKLQEPFTDQSGINISTEDNFLKVTKDLAVSSAGHVLAGNEVLPSNPAHLQAAIINSTDLVSTLKNTNLDFTHQIYTTIDEESSNQDSPVLQGSSMIAETGILEEESSIYELLFKLSSLPSNISPSVVEAVHLAMKETPEEAANLTEASEAIMRQILSLDYSFNVIIAPTVASAYAIAVFASMLRVDPLSVSSQISSRLSSPLAVIHDACCAQMAGMELGPLKSCTALTGSYNWNLGDTTYPMDRDMLRMAVQSNRVAAVFYQPYAYIDKSQHISLEVVSSVCRSRATDVAVIVDASTMPTANINLSMLTAEVKEFFNHGADLVLMPSVDKLCGHSHSSVLVGVSNLLSKVWRSIVLLQKQVCLPLHCLPHDLVGTVVAYKALQDINE